MIGYLCKSLRIISLVWPTRWIFLAMGEVLSFGFNLPVLDPSDRKGNDTARLNPKLSTSPIARKINLVGQTKPIIRKRLEKISNHAYKNSEKNQILFIAKLDHKSTIHRISANTPQKSITSNRSPRESGELCIEIQRERRSHLANNYGPEGLW